MAVAADVGDGDAVADVGTGGDGGVDEDRVEHGAPRRVERVDAVRGFDRDGDLVVGVVEGGAPDGRGAGVDDAVEQPPAVELEDAAAHQGVGREGVGAVAAAVDDEDGQAGAGEQHGGGGAGGAGADDDDVVVGTVGVHGGLRSRSGDRRRALCEVVGDEGGVAADAVDEVRAAVVLEALAEHVQAAAPA